MLSNGEIYTAYITAANQTLRPQDERIALAFAREIETAVLKAQAGEPESNLAAFFKLDEQAMELIHPTTERPYNAKVTGSPALSASPSGLPGYATEVEK